MSTSGVQTHDFLMRLKKAEDSLPPLLLELAGVMQRMVEEIERPQLEDIQGLQAELRRLDRRPAASPGYLRHRGPALRPMPVWGLSAFRVPLCFGATGPVPALDRHRPPPAHRSPLLSRPFNKG